jgi:hypothetical protein
MKISNGTLASLLALATMAAALPANAQMKQLEQGIEASASTIVLPATETGRLDIRACADCPAESLLASPKSRYFVGSQALSLAEFTRYLREHPQATLTVFSVNNTRNLSRVKVQGVTDDRGTAKHKE